MEAKYKLGDTIKYKWVTITVSNIHISTEPVGEMGFYEGVAFFGSISTSITYTGKCILTGVSHTVPESDARLVKRAGG